MDLAAVFTLLLGMASPATAAVIGLLTLVGLYGTMTGYANQALSLTGREKIAQLQAMKDTLLLASRTIVGRMEYAGQFALWSQQIDQINAAIDSAIAKEQAALALPTPAPTPTQFTWTPQDILANLTPALIDLDDLRNWWTAADAAYRQGILDFYRWEGTWMWFSSERLRLCQLAAAGVIPRPSGPEFVSYDGEPVSILLSNFTYPWQTTPPVVVPTPPPAPTPAPIIGLDPASIAALSFATIAAAAQWIDGVNNLYTQGKIDIATLNLAMAKYNSEVTRLSTGITPTSGAITVQPINNVYVTPNINVNVPPFPAIPVQVTNIVNPPMITNILDTGALTSALPLIGTGIAAALVGVAENLGHGMSQGRNTCLSSTGQSIMSLLMPGLQIGGIMAFLNAPDSLRGVVDPIVKHLFDSLFTFPEISHPIVPDDAPRVAESIFLRAVGLGISAHLASQASEAFSPLKFMGLPYFSAMLADMAGFSRIAAATMGIVESQALGLPMRYHVNQAVRTGLPSIRELQDMVSERHLVNDTLRRQLTQSVGTLGDLEVANRSEFMKWAPYNNFSDEWLEKYYETSSRPVSYFALRAIADSGQYDEPFFISELAHNGYEVPAIVKLLGMLKRMAIVKDTDALAGESRYDLIDGFIDPDTYTSDLVALGKEPSVVDALAEAAQARRLRDWRKKRAAYLLTAAVARRITETDLQDELTAMQFVPERIDMYMEELALRRKVETTADVVTATERELANEIEQQVKLGMKDITYYKQRIEQMGMSKAEVTDKVETATLERERYLAGHIKLDEAPKITTEDRDIASELEKQVLAGMLNTDQYRQALIARPWSPKQIDDMVYLAGLKMARKSATGAA